MSFRIGMCIYKPLKTLRSFQKLTIFLPPFQGECHNFCDVWRTAVQQGNTVTIRISTRIRRCIWLLLSTQLRKSWKAVKMILLPKDRAPNYCPLRRKKKTLLESSSEPTTPLELMTMAAVLAGGGGHIENLKEKLVDIKKGIFASICQPKTEGILFGPSYNRKQSGL